MRWGMHLAEPVAANWVAVSAGSGAKAPREVPRVRRGCLIVPSRLPDSRLGARTLRTSTFFGAFERAADGLQRGLRLSVVRRRAGVAELFLAEAA